MDGFPSGQRGQTVNLLAMPSVVRIHHPPPRIDKLLQKVVDFYFLPIHSSLETMADVGASIARPLLPEIRI